MEVFLLICAYVLGVYRSQMVSLFLLLSYAIMDVLLSYVEHTSPHTLNLIFTIHYVVMPLILMLFFSACLHYADKFWEIVAVWCGLIGYFLVSVGIGIYIPYLTEFMVEYGDSVKEECVVNLMLTMFIERNSDMEDELSKLRSIVMVSVFIMVKMVQYTS